MVFVSACRCHGLWFAVKVPTYDGISMAGRHIYNMCEVLGVLKARMLLRSNLLQMLFSVRSGKSVGPSQQCGLDRS